MVSEGIILDRRHWGTYIVLLEDDKTNKAPQDRGEYCKKALTSDLSQ